MTKDDVFVNSVQNDIEVLVKDLIYNTLAPFKNEIDLVAANICHSIIAPLGADGYKCVILIKNNNGMTLRFVSHDCDELLALYNTLDNTVDNFRSGKMNLDFDTDCGRMQTDNYH